jgi:hypothetical protein
MTGRDQMNNKWTEAIEKLNVRLEMVEGNLVVENKIKAMIEDFVRQGGVNTAEKA